MGYIPIGSSNYLNIGGGAVATGAELSLKARVSIDTMLMITTVVCYVISLTVAVFRTSWVAHDDIIVTAVTTVVMTVTMTVATVTMPVTSSVAVVVAEGRGDVDTTAVQNDHHPVVDKNQS